MVLWEITLGTAYFLGLKRTYRLALRIQRRLITPKRPKVRQFVHRRTRAVFDVALKVHQNIQERDLEVGRNLGNWILRWLDKMKPSAQIRVSSPGEGPSGDEEEEERADDGLKLDLNLGVRASGSIRHILHHNGISRQGCWVSLIVDQLVHIHLLYFLGHHPAICAR
ncbi:hypothetical protein F0562_007703 [Nyssa sinensis]|uniref:Uncharacterized protein n=1 Tax=Nyssa sinensis TaxID=561372 RepID=A0A5J5A746_9ASTE|nr:hypothetical protein F0562_007703 [Nyssa sinensis]